MDSDASVSDDSRKEAAAFLKKGLFLEAAAAYTKSLAFAPAASKGLCYAGRSAVLLASGHFLQCVQDAERALTHGYPQLLQFKLLLRMAACWRALDEDRRAQCCFLEALALIEACQQLSEEKKRVLVEEAGKEFEGPLERERALWVQYVKAPEVSYGSREDNHRLSSAVEVKCDGEFGRHLVATRDINTGDVLVLEKPAIAFLIETENSEKGNKEAIWTHCSHCYKMSLNLEPCSTCNWALYCCQTCKEQAWSHYHKVECRLRRKYEGLKAPSDPESTSSWVRIMLTLLSSFSPSACLHPEDDPGLSEFLALLPDVYPEEKMNRVERLSRKVCDVCCEEMDEDDRTRLSKVLTRALLNFQRNSYTIDESHFVPSIDAFRSREVIGRGFYPTVALINHSCDANTTRVFHLDTQVVRAVRPIKKGEQVFAGYGPDYGGMDRTKRRAVLSRKFYFECECEACENDWPLATANLGFVPDFLRQPPRLQLLREVVQTVIATKTIQGRHYSTIVNENIFKKCLALQKKYFDAGASRVDWIYFFTEKFIVNHLDMSAKKIADKDDDGEPYLSTFNEDTIFQC